MKKKKFCLNENVFGQQSPAGNLLLHSGDQLVREFISAITIFTQGFTATTLDIYTHTNTRAYTQLQIHYIGTDI